VGGGHLGRGPFTCERKRKAPLGQEQGKGGVILKDFMDWARFHVEAGTIVLPGGDRGWVKNPVNFKSKTESLFQGLEGTASIGDRLGNGERLQSLEKKGYAFL